MAQTEVRTFRGRSLEELVPKIREELGADAIVVRSREALEGGVAGFFQRQVVEVQARPPLDHEREDAAPAVARNDRATAEGLASPGVAQLVAEAQPFADELARAQRGAASRAAEDVLAAHAEALAPAFVPDEPPAAVPAPAAAPAPAPAGLYGPQPNFAALAEATPALVAPAPASLPVPVPAPALGVAPAPAAPARPAAAGAIERRLVAAGLSADLAADVVGEAVAHHLPFSGPRRLPAQVRRVLAARIPVLADLGAVPRSLAVAGPAGSGKTAAVANLAVAYAAAGARVAVFALGDAAGRAPLAARLEPLGIPVHVATDAAAVRAALDRATPDVALVDTPALRPGDDAAVAVLADALRRVAVDEVHLALPATSSPAAADEVLTALRPLGLTHAALTHADATGHPGAAVEALIGARLALSYCCTRATVQPADPADVAERLL